MRPLKLTLKGLNSFSEEQTVDFARLTEHGFFGIFGPTGSGKSSILDGVTLALYGEIARGSDEYIHKSMDQARVSFEFQLTGEETRRYRVEREIRRNPKGGIRTAFARLLQLKESGEEVLEEKVAAVKTRCEEIIGLKAEDFARTVVLPQGKFSEFLKLQNAPRRLMLERIFNLEQYGETLMEKVGARLRQCREENTRLGGHLMSYEGVSEEAVATLQERLRQAEAALLQARGEEASQAATFETADGVRRLQLELEEILLQMEAHGVRASAMEDIRHQLADGDRAAAVWPQWHGWSEGLRALKDSEERLTRLRQSAADGEQRYEALRQALDEAGRRKDGEIPGLTRRAAELEAGLEELGRLKGEETALERQQTVVEELRQQERRDALQLQELQRQIQRLEADLRDGRQQLDGLHTPEAVKQQATEALEHSRELQRIRQLLTDQGALRQRLKAASEAGSRQAETLRQALEELRARLSEAEEHQQQEMARRLRTHLVPGDPCPVCGALEHPWAVAAEEGAPGDAAEKLTPKVLWEQVAQAEKGLGALQGQLGSERQQLADAEAAMAALGEQESTVMARLGGLLTALGTEDPQQRWERISRQEKSAEALAARLQSQQPMLETLMKEQEALSAALGSLRERLSREDGVLSTLQQSCGERRRALLSRLGPLETLETALQETVVGIQALQLAYESARLGAEAAEAARQATKEALAAEEQTCRMLATQEAAAGLGLKNALEAAGFADADQMLGCLKAPEILNGWREALEAYGAEAHRLEGAKRQVEEKLQGRMVSREAWEQAQGALAQAAEQVRNLVGETAALRQETLRLEADYAAMKTLLMEKEASDRLLGRLEDLNRVFSGRRFVAYIAAARLRHICGQASEQLMQITAGAYALEADEDGSFQVRDYRNGGVCREAGTLSGGETFMVSLALALALSAQIQLKGKAQLELFFLDEGFGTLDDDTLDNVLSALENMPHEKLSVGLISHVEAIRNRVPAKLMVTPAQAGISGSRVRFELS